MESAVLSAECHEDSVICGLNSGEVVMHNIEDGRETRRKEMHSKGIKVVTVKDQKLYTGSYDGSVKVSLKANTVHAPCSASCCFTPFNNLRYGMRSGIT